MAAEERKFQDPEYDYYDIEDEEEEGGRGPILVVVAIIVLTAFIGVVLVAYNQGVKEGRQQVPPILRADQGPVRETPPEVASAEPPKSPSAQIFSPSKPSEPETMAPPPEEPMAVPKPAPAAPSTALNVPALSAPSLPGAPTKNVEVKTAPEPGAPSAAAPAPAVAAPAAAPAAPPASAAPAASGSYLVQIGSFKSDTEANATWEKIKTKNADILSSYAPNVVSVELGAKGTYQRLRFGPFETREAAANVCDQLKARKQDCLLAKQ
jgi:cell division septation protein DedD